MVNEYDKIITDKSQKIELWFHLDFFIIINYL